MRRRVVLTAALAVSAAALTVHTEPLPQEPIALVNGHVVNVADGTVQRNVSVVLRAGRIEALGAPVPAGVKTLDLRGRYVVPGLIDVHVHLENLRALRSALLVVSNGRIGLDRLTFSRSEHR